MAEFKEPRASIRRAVIEGGIGHMSMNTARAAGGHSIKTSI
jgi:hypothetical protein